MKINKYIIIVWSIIFTISANTNLLAQKKLKKILKEANQNYYDKHYSEAYTLYKQYWTEKNDKDVLIKMADCNYQNRNLIHAQIYYEMYFNGSMNSSDENFEEYAQCTHAAGKVELAAKLYEKLYEKNQDEATKDIYQTLRLFVDSSKSTHSFNLDSSYNCVSLDATDSYDPEAAPVDYIWDFGDGETQEGVKVEHCFTEREYNQITLNVRDQRTGYIRSRDTAILIIVDQPPVNFAAPKQIKQYMIVDFIAFVNDIYGYKILEYFWDFGDGFIQSGKKAKHKFTKLDEYNVKLYVVAQNITTKEKKLYTSYKKIPVMDNYRTPNKSFPDNLNDAK